MSYPNRAGAEGTRAALLASNPAKAVQAGMPVPPHEHPDLDSRISALESRPGRGEVESEGDDES